ncbi:MAG: MFS transporter [Variibacter sp.]|nr:MFS transporter [Variibacter sp.]
MTAVVEFAKEAGIDDRLARRNTLVLAVAQAFGLANNVIIFTTASIVGAMLAPDKTLATLPVSIYVLGLWAATLPIGALARRFGRRTAFQIGTAFGVLTGLLCGAAVILNSFLLFNLGTFCTGFYAAATQAYRFAATDTASESFKPKAISWVLMGGIGGAILGPQLVIATQDLWQPYVFVASYAAQSLLAVAAAGVLSLLKIPRPAGRGGAPARPPPPPGVGPPARGAGRPGGGGRGPRRPGRRGGPAPAPAVRSRRFCANRGSSRRWRAGSRAMRS